MFLCYFVVILLLFCCYFVLFVMLLMNIIFIFILKLSINIVTLSLFSLSLFSLQYLTGPFTALSVAYGGQLLACFTETGVLMVVSTDFHDNKIVFPTGFSFLFFSFFLLSLLSYFSLFKVVMSLLNNLFGVDLTLF